MKKYYVCKDGVNMFILWNEDKEEYINFKYLYDCYKYILENKVNGLLIYKGGNCRYISTIENGYVTKTYGMKLGGE